MGHREGYPEGGENAGRWSPLAPCCLTSSRRVGGGNKLLLASSHLPSGGVVAMMERILNFLLFLMQNQTIPFDDNYDDFMGAGMGKPGFFVRRFQSKKPSTCFFACNKQLFFLGPIPTAYRQHRILRNFHFCLRHSHTHRTRDPCS